MARATEFIISVRRSADWTNRKIHWWKAVLEFEDDKGPQTVVSDLWIGSTPQSAAEPALRWIENYDNENPNFSEV